MAGLHLLLAHVVVTRFQFFCSAQLQIVKSAAALPIFLAVVGRESEAVREVSRLRMPRLGYAWTLQSV